MGNWNKINMAICFNYLQQQFILIASTMKALASEKKGAAGRAIVYLQSCAYLSAPKELRTQCDQYLQEDALREIA